MDLSDDDYEHVSDVDMCESESDQPSKSQESAPSSPPSIRNLSASRQKTLVCPYDHCPKTFNRKSRLDEHIRSHQNIRLFKCLYKGCGKEYLRQSHLNHHSKTAHSQLRDYECTWEGCDKSFATGTRLRRHIQAHEGREKFRCRGYAGCDETFRKHETLRKHIMSVHQQVQPYACEQLDTKTGQQCTRAFETADKLKVHQRTMHDAGRFTCADCFDNPSMSQTIGVSTSSFATYSELRAHIADIHPPTCQYCPTSFATLKELNRHLEIQHGWVDPNLPKDSTFACEFPNCGRAFTKRGNLNVHIKTVHEKKKDFVCGVTAIPVPDELRSQGDIEVFGCGRDFTSKASLEDHVRSAHFGLETKLIERRKKRKAEMAASRESNGQRVAPQIKKTRKDKGVKRASAFAELTGQPLFLPKEFETTKTNRSLTEGYGIEQTPEPGKDTLRGPEDEGEGEADEWNQLSGSMVLFGSRMYHNGHEYQYEDGQYASGMTNPSTEKDLPCARQQSADDSTKFNYLANYEDEPVFDNFEHEPEFMNGLHLDPVLLHS